MEDEILRQLAHERAAEKETLKMQEDNVRKPKLTIDDEIVAHKRRINELENQKFQAGNPIFEKQRMRKLRLEVEKHKREQQKINAALEMQGAQLTHKDPSGRLVFGS